ncbi:MAG: ethanolamine ammonia-lyase reactivating factor EutA [Oscillospiraceae bacterium]|nr:ethanolamine ammonia-lyase reactivating factor EutA [Oscillospiraceae bacterium]
MGESLLSVGLDVGTTSTQMILSKLNIENKAGAFSVPEMEISEREIVYKSEVHFTPLRGADLVDAEKLRTIIADEYKKAGAERTSVDTGAIIITGETSRKENADAVLHELSDFAGDFVVATAGPDLESVLAAKGAGADKFSEKTGKTVLHMDIGGGTSNLALIKDGRIVKTGCLNVGGRLVKFDEAGKVTYVSPVLRGLCDVCVGDHITERTVEDISKLLVSALEMVCAKRGETELLRKLATEGTDMAPVQADVISFSGGVADCIDRDVPWRQYGDIGPVLGREIRKSLLCSEEYVLGEETIRATVIGAGCHSAQLSGSTVFYQNITFPLKNIPVVKFGESAKLHEDAVFWSIEDFGLPDYSRVAALADEIVNRVKSGPVYICVERDMAKALGQAVAMKAAKDRPILCVDRIKLLPESYMDVGEPVGPALPVVIKTLVLSN